MKFKITLAFFLFFGYALQSQVLIALLLGDKLNSGKIEFGLDGGINFAAISGMDSFSYNRNWNLGFYFDIQMKEQWYLNTGVLVKSVLGLDNLSENDLEFLNATTYDVDGEYQQKINYFLVPALAKYKFKNHMYAEIGPQFGLAYNAFIEFNSQIDDNEAVIKDGNLDDINRFDVGLAGGVGYRLLKGLGWTLGVRYYYGFVDVYKERSNTKNNSLFLKMNVPIGLSQEKKDEAKQMKASNQEKKAKKKQEKKERKEAEKEASQKSKDSVLL